MSAPRAIRATANSLQLGLLGNLCVQKSAFFNRSHHRLLNLRTHFIESGKEGYSVSIDLSALQKEMIRLLLSMSRSLRFDRIVLLTWLLLPTAVLTEAAACERLKASLTYTQEEAPRDLSGVVSQNNLVFRKD